MEELRPEELQVLVEELEGESEEEEALSPEVEELLRDLHPDSQFALRKKAAEQLGGLGTSHPRIVSALVAVQAFDKNHVIRTLAAESLRAPVHQEMLREHPDLMQRAQPAAEQAEIQRERQREEQREKQTREKQREKEKRERQRAIEASEVHNRKNPEFGRWDILWFIAFGIVWVGVITAAGATKVPWVFGLAALPGVAVVVWGFWLRRSATIHRDLFLRSMKETVGTVEYLRETFDDGHYWYYVTVCFEAEDAEMGTRLMVLKASVSHGVWKGLNVDQSVCIRYAAEDPRIAFFQWEW